MNAYVQRVFDGLKARNPQEKEFLMDWVNIADYS